MRTGNLARRESASAERSFMILMMPTLVLLIGLFFCIVPQVAAAQAERVATSISSSVNTGAEAPLQRLARVQLNRVPLVESLSSLRDNAGVRITFSPSLLPDDLLVTCHCEQVTVGEALKRILSRSGFRYAAMGGQIVVEPRVEHHDARANDLDSGTEAVRVPSRHVYPVRLRSPRLNGVGRSEMTGSITGTVIDAQTLRPLATAQVSVEGTQRGDLTNQNGRYTLENIPAGEITLTIQLLGYATAQATFQLASGETVTRDFRLSQEALGLDEIVVTGTAGQARRREVGTSIAAIRAQDIQAAAVRHPQDILAGRIAGATVMANTGQPGQGGTILLRGNNSISQGNEPLIYVDGVRLFSGGSPGGTLPLNDISPDQIERIEVVRGAAATTLYGTEASSGVIQVFTRQGAAGAASWTAEAQTGFNSLNTTRDGDPSGFFLMQCNGPNLVNSLGETFEDVTCPSSGSWLQKGMIQRYSVSVQGGAPDPHVTYFLGGNFNDEKGVVAPGGSRQGALRGNFTFRPEQSIQLGVNMSYNNRSSRFIPDGNYLRGFLLNVMRGPANNYKVGGEPANAHVLEQEMTNDAEHFIMGLTTNWDPSDRLGHRVTLGYDLNSVENQTLIPFGHQGVPLGSMSLNVWTNTTLSLDYAGSFRNNFGENIASTFSWGGQLFENRRRSRGLSANDFSGPGAPTLSSAARTSVNSDVRLRVINAGFFLQEMIGVQDRLFITAGLRVDGNSAFGSSFGLQPYPKVSVSYVLSDHDAWPDRLAESLKLRAAVGESGKAPGAFDAVQTWSPISADDGQPAFTPGQLGNPDLGPERSREYEVGFDAVTLNGRLAIDFTYFRQRTSDALVPVTPPPSMGFLSSQLENVGQIDNSGLELALEGRLFQSQSIEWVGRFNVGVNKSEVIDMAGQVIKVGSGRWNNTLQEGYPVPSFIGEKVLNPDEFADPVIEEDAFIGPSYPTRTIGVGTTLGVGSRISFDVLGEYQGGHFQQNAVGFQNAARNVWRPCYEAQERIRAGDLSQVTALERERCNRGSPHAWIQPADFFKLRTASVTFQLPADRIRGVRNAALTVSGRNLLTITDYDGLDPEVNDFGRSLNRQEYYNLPPTRTFLASIRVGF